MLKTKGRAIVSGILCGVALTVFFVMLEFVSCARGEDAASDADELRISQTRLLLGTSCTITIVRDDISRLGIDAEEIFSEAFRLCEDLEALFSMTLEGSDVWRVNHAQGQAVEIDAQVMEVIEKGLYFSELSGGMFDITIGRLTDIWSKYFAQDLQSVTNMTPPSPDELAGAAQTVGYQQVRTDGNTIQLEAPEAWLDLGGIAKGYIADRVTALLRERGVENALIDLGGDVTVIGNRPDGGAWRLGVQRPFGAYAEIAGVIEITDTAAVGSGVYERRVNINDVNYHHIINPFTGMPSESDVIGATVIARDAVTGEGLSTIAVLTGSRDAESIFMDTPGFIGAVLVLSNNEVIVIGDAVLLEYEET